MEIFSPVSFIMENLTSEVIELDHDITIKDAIGIFENNRDTILVIAREGGSLSIVDKEILLDMLMKGIDKNESIMQFGTREYCVKNLNDNADNIDGKFIIVTDNLGRIKGAVRSESFRRLVEEVESSSELNLDIVNQAMNLISEMASFNNRVKNIVNYKRVETIGSKLWDDRKSDPCIIINGIMPLKKARDMVERDLINKVMNTVNSTYKAAEILEVSQATVARKAKRYNNEMVI